MAATPGTVGARVLEIVERDKRSAAAISRAAGLNEDFIRDLIRRPNQSPTLANIEKLAEELQVPPEWLAFGCSAGELRNPPLLKMSILGEVAAGVWREADSEQANIETELLSDHRFPADAQYLLAANGTSMNKVIFPGDLLHCVDLAKTGLRPISGDIVIVERRRASGECEVSAKRLHEKKDGAMMAADSTDPKWEAFTLNTTINDGDAITVVAVVVRAVRIFM